MVKVNVACVYWGNKYSQEYVTRLYEMVRRNTSYNFNMYCLTDRPHLFSGEITTLKLAPGFEGWWNKMQLFRVDILPAGQYLYFDLDVVIVDNIDCFFEYEGFGITRDFINPERGLLGDKEYNSSVMRFSPNGNLWQHFLDNQARWIEAQKQVPFFGDQNVISDFINKQGYKGAFPDEWIWSYKVGSLRGRRPIDHSRFFGSEIPSGGKVCVFHGRPNPDEVEVDWVTKHWLGLHPETYSVTVNKNHENQGVDTGLPVRVVVDSQSTSISIGKASFAVPTHWFWPQFGVSWEPQTFKFFKNNLVPGKDYLDIGAWIGPTALLATALGAAKVKIVEPNPKNFLNLLVTQLNNRLLEKWFLINACISNQRGALIIGPVSGIAKSSSATNIRDQNQGGAKIISLCLSDLILEEDNFSLIKIDIEGAEELIISDFPLLANQEAAIWLSIHPPFIRDKELFMINLLSLREQFNLVDENNVTIEESTLRRWITTDEEFPSWGTRWGNFFEIGILPKAFFGIDGVRKGLES